jgi:hypothetical protein
MVVISGFLFSTRKRQEKSLIVWPKAEIAINGSSNGQDYKTLRKQVAMNHMIVRVVYYVQFNYLFSTIWDVSRDSAVGIATGYELDDLEV